MKRPQPIRYRVNTGNGECFYIGGKAASVEMAKRVGGYVQYRQGDEWFRLGGGAPQPQLLEKRRKEKSS
jgi:hypothetical protein